MAFFFIKFFLGLVLVFSIGLMISFVLEKLFGLKL